jgi:hypothetical protein
VAEAKAGIGAWLRCCNDERQHQSLGYRTPTSQLDWLISITAISVLFSSRAASDLLRSFGCGMGHPVGSVAATMMPFSRRSPHRISYMTVSRMLSCGSGRRRSVMSAIKKGCEIVLSKPIGRGVS